MEQTLKMLGKRIAYLRNKKGITQEKLAELINYSPNHISKLESARTSPSFDLLVMIAKALDIDLKEIFNFDEYEDKCSVTKELQAYIKNTDTKQIKLLYKLCKFLNNI